MIGLKATSLMEKRMEMENFSSLMEGTSNTWKHRIFSTMVYWFVQMLDWFGSQSGLVSITVCLYYKIKFIKPAHAIPCSISCCRVILETKAQACVSVKWSGFSKVLLLCYFKFLVVFVPRLVFFCQYLGCILKWEKGELYPSHCKLCMVQNEFNLWADLGWI